MFLDGVLISAKHLVNGATIVQEKPENDIHYFHVELASHDVLLAEGAFSESFVDDDSRTMFQNAHEFKKLYPEARPKEIVYCAPRVEDGYILDRVRRRLAERAGLASPAATDFGALLGEVEDVATMRAFPAGRETRPFPTRRCASTCWSTALSRATPMRKPKDRMAAAASPSASPRRSIRHVRTKSNCGVRPMARPWGRNRPIPRRRKRRRPERSKLRRNQRFRTSRQNITEFQIGMLRKQRV